MMTWGEFAAEAPQLAGEGQRRFDASGLILLGTVRRDGHPRLSPVEPIITDGQLYLGMIHRSTKALDLHREPRCVVHNTITGRDGQDGEFKVYGHGRSIEDADERERYCVALFEAIAWRPEGEFDLFAIDIDQIAFVIFGDGKQTTKVWRPGQAVRESVTTP
jgi:hypothetical protein